MSSITGKLYIPVFEGEGATTATGLNESSLRTVIEGGFHRGTEIEPALKLVPLKNSFEVLILYPTNELEPIPLTGATEARGRTALRRIHTLALLATHSGVPRRAACACILSNPQTLLNTSKKLRFSPLFKP